MKKLVLLLAIIVSGFALLAGGRAVTRPTLKYFKPKEFGIWYPLMSAELLKKLDKFRERWGRPVMVSPVEGGIGRHGGDSATQHNVDRWGEVRAIDVFPEGMTSATERQRAYDIAKEVGFTGIGIYTDTVPSNLLHVDVRADRVAGDPAKWSRVNGKYGAIAEVLA